MKKVLTCLLVAFAIMFMSFGTTTVNAAQNENYNDYSTYIWLEEFIKDNPSRTVGTEGEAKAASWISTKLEGMGYTPTKQQFDVYVYDVVGISGEQKKSCNVIAQKNSDTQNAQTVIIGAHYDDASQMYNGNLASGGNGVMDNGSSIAVLLDLAQKLSVYTGNLPYNMQFVFFGGEEQGMIGSNYFASNLTQAQCDNVLMMINLDNIASGDHLYVWGEDISTPQADYFVNKSNGKINHTPADKMTIGMGLGYRPYYNVAQASDHMEFLVRGIPVSFIFSGNMSCGNFAYVENDGKNDVSHTSNDTINSLKERCGIQFVQNMQTVADVLYAGVVVDANEFATAVKDARSYIIDDFWLNSGNAMLVFAVVALLFVVFAINYYKKLQKRAILGNADVKTTTVFEKPDEDDIFTFRS